MSNIITDILIKTARWLKPGRDRKAWSLHPAALLGVISAALTLCACTDEIGGGEGERGGEFISVSLPGYLSVNFNTGAATRASSFDDGDNAEFALAPGSYHYVLLYGEGETPVAVLPVSADNTELNSANNITVSIKDAFVSTDSYLPRNINNKDDLTKFFENEVKEAYALLNVNISDIKTESGSASLSSGLSGLTKSALQADSFIGGYSISVGGKEYFTMTTSTYVSGSTVTYGYKINSSKVYDSKEKALAETGDFTLTCYVERLAAKITIDTSGLNKIEYTSDSGSDDEASDDGADRILFRVNTGSTVKLYDKNDDGGLKIGDESYAIAYNDKGWEVEVTGFGLNALEQSSRLVKYIKKTDYFSFKALDGSLYGATNWRSPWAEDKNYLIDGNTDLSSYPDQFRRSLEKTVTTRSNHAGGYTSDDKINVASRYGSYLSYKSFNEILGDPGVMYAHENTYDDSDGILGERGYFSAGTHLIMTGRIKINDVATATDLYYDQNSIFYTNEYDLLENKLAILNKIVLKEGNHGIRVLDVDWLNHSDKQEDDEIDGLVKMEWAKDAVLWIGDIEATPDNLRLIEAEIAGGDGALLIAPEKGADDIYIAPAIGEGDSRRRDTANSIKISQNRLISLFYKIIGPVEHFKSGYVYYAAPIPHNVVSVIENSDSYKTPGDIGVVRNHWYEIKVNSLMGVGRAVDNPDQPIIPTRELKRSYLNITVKIAEWHKISQSIDQDYPNI